MVERRSEERSLAAATKIYARRVVYIACDWNERDTWLTLQLVARNRGLNNLVWVSFNPIQIQYVVTGP